MPVWAVAENVSSTGIRSPDRPARGESLYQLRHMEAAEPLFMVWLRACPHSEYNFSHSRFLSTLPTTSRVQNPYWETNSPKPSTRQKILRILQYPNFITVFPTAHHLSLSSASWTEPTHFYIYFRTILLFSSPLRLSIPNYLVPSAFSTETPCIFTNTHTYYMSIQSHFPWFDHHEIEW